MSEPYRDTPDQTKKGMPGGVPFIIGNELAERFSFYGMKGILKVFMTAHLLDAAGDSAFMSDNESNAWYHGFTGLAYTTPILGAMIADIFWGKYKTILYLSLLYCVGHGCLAMMDVAPAMGMGMKPWLIAGMFFIALGAGAIKPCVSAHVGDQFGSGNKHLLPQIFNWFYLSINVGAVVAILLIPQLLNGFKVGTDEATGEAILFGGPWLAFGLPGVLMAIATFVFWCGRNKFIHVPPAGWAKWKQETFSPEGKRALLNLSPLFLLFVPVFWSIFDQTGAAWVAQAQQMDRNVFGWEILPSQTQFLNPALILLGVPFFTLIGYPMVSKIYPLTPLRKIGIGFVLTAMSFALSAWIESRITAGETPTIWWQVLAYVILTSGEIMVSIVCLEFAYTQSPRKMKSFIMGVYFLGVALGNYLASGINIGIEATRAEDGSSPLDGSNYYWLFAAMMAVATVVYIVWTKTYKGETFIQGEEAVEIAEAQAEAQGPDAR
ncbi:MAG: POT family MFS transporter [Phycisphaerales bacterium]